MILLYSVPTYLISIIQLYSCPGPWWLKRPVV